MNLQKVTFPAYAPGGTLASLTSQNPSNQLLRGLRMMLTGVHLDFSRRDLVSALIAVGATVHDDKEKLCATTVLVVCPYANPRWSSPNRGGRKIERAERLGALIVSYTQLMELFRSRGTRLRITGEQLNLFPE